MNFDHELIVDFLGEYDDAQIEVEKALKLLAEKLDEEALNTLFRVIHSIKGNFRMMELNPLSETIHSLEDSLSQIRDNQRQLIPGYSLLISATLEQCKEISKQIFIGQDKTKAIDQLTQIYNTLCQSSANQYSQTLLSSLEKIDELGEYGNDYSCQPLIDFFQQQKSKTKQKAHKKKPTPQKIMPINDALDFFEKIITQIESYFPYWKGRSEKILKLVTQMNEVYGYPVEPQQLQAAVYLHDFGMSFVPPQKIYLSKDLNEADRIMMHSHCEIGFQWLNLIPGWEEAAMMILQHHEFFDGKGYPLGLAGKQLCEGAKILAIGDAYASITGQEKKGSQSRPIMNAVAEINHGAGFQFDPEWVKVFNQVIRNQKN